MIPSLSQEPFFWISLTLGIYLFFVRLQTKIQSSLLQSLINPLFITISCLIAFLVVTGVSYEDYQLGGQYIGFWVTPATVSFAIILEVHFNYLKKFWPAILSGIVTGVVCHTLAILIFAFFFQFDFAIIATLYPKSITTAFAIGVSESMGGLSSLTVAIVVLTGILDTVVGPNISRACRINHPVAQGIALGSTAHAMGTAKTIELGPVQGTMSGIVLVITGLVVLLSPLVPLIIQIFL